jgi:hypothetical protein
MKRILMAVGIVEEVEHSPKHRPKKKRLEPKTTNPESPPL